MAFWNIGGFHTVSAVERVLAQKDHTLRDILAAEDVLHEMQTPNARLVDILAQEAVILELVDIVAGDSHDNASTSEGLTTDEPGSDSIAATSEASTDSETVNKDSAPSYDNPEDEKGDTGSKEEADVEIQDVGSPMDHDFGSKLDSESDGHLEGVVKGSKGWTSVSNHHHEDQESKDDLIGGDQEDDDDDDDSSRDDDNLDEEFDDNEAQDEDDLRKVATEILSTEVWLIMDVLVGSREALNRLWAIMEAPESPNLSGPALTRYNMRLSNFTKIMESLLEKRTDMMLDHLKRMDNLADLFMKHVDNPSLVDLLLKIISTDHPDSPTGMLDVLYRQKLIPKMISRLAPDVPQSEQMAMGDFLKAFVTISGGNKSESFSIGPNQLSRQLVSDECVAEIIRLMLKGGSGMCIAVGVIIEIIRKNNSDYDYVQVLYTTLESHPPSPRDSIYLGGLLKQFAQAIPQFQKMLVAKRDDTMEMPFGQIEPLGFERFRLCELYAELLHCSNMGLLNDPRGEAIVKARDQERERLQRQTYPDVETDAETETELLSSIANSSSGSIGDASKSKSSSDVSASLSDGMDPASLALSQEPISPPVDQLEKFEVEDIVAESHPGSQPPSPSIDKAGEQLDARPPLKHSESELVGDALVAELARQEKSIREDPVVGDLLKVAFDDNNCIGEVFNMLFRFPWNNFLHNVVFDIVQQVFNGSIEEGYNKFLAIHFFSRDHITEQIVKGQNENDQYEREHGTRLGYVGHLTLISEEVVKFVAVFPPDSISPVVAEAMAEPSWTHYVGHTLIHLREQYNTILGNHKIDGDEGDVSADGLGANHGEDAGDLDTRTTSGAYDEDEDMAVGVAGDASRVETAGRRSGPLELDDDNGQFRLYMSNQLTSRPGHFGSSDEDEDDDWETVDQTRQRNPDYREFDNSDDEEEEEEEEEEGEDGQEVVDDGLGLVRSRSYNH